MTKIGRTKADSEEPSFYDVMRGLFITDGKRLRLVDIGEKYGVGKSMVCQYFKEPADHFTIDVLKKTIAMFPELADRFTIIDALSKVHEPVLWDIIVSSDSKDIAKSTSLLIRANRPQEALKLAKFELRKTTDPSDRFRILQTIHHLHIKLTNYGEAIAVATHYEHEAEKTNPYRHVGALILKVSAMRLSGSYEYKLLEAAHDQIRSLLDDLEPSNSLMLKASFEGEYATTILNQLEERGGLEKNRTYLQYFLKELDRYLEDSAFQSLAQGIFGMKARVFTALGNFEEARFALSEGIDRSLDSIVTGLDTFRLAYVELLIAEKQFDGAKEQARRIAKVSMARQDMFTHRSAQRLMTKAMKVADFKVAN